MSRAARQRAVSSFLIASAVFAFGGCGRSPGDRERRTSTAEKASVSPLILAAGTSDLSSVNALLRGGANVNATDKAGYAPSLRRSPRPMK